MTWIINGKSLARTIFTGKLSGVVENLDRVLVEKYTYALDDESGKIADGDGSAEFHLSNRDFNFRAAANVDLAKIAPYFYAAGVRCGRTPSPQN